MTPDRVLVVEDDEGLLNLMALSLRRRGYQVEQAPDGYAAIKILSSQPPFSVLLTDLMMPGMSGIELLREAKKIDRHIETVVVTAAPDLESVIASMRSNGAYDYLLKPFESMSQLLLAVERAAAQRQMHLEQEKLRLQVQDEAERLRAIMNNTGDAVISANADGILQIVNPAAARLLSSDKLEGKDALASLPPNLARLIANWQTIGGNLPSTVEMAWPDGTVQMVSLNPIPETGHMQWGWLVILRDITHIKHLEEVKAQLLVEASGRIRLPLAQAMNSLVELNTLAAQDDRINQVVSRLTQIWKRIQEWSDDLDALMRIDSKTAFQPSPIDVNELMRDIQQKQAQSLIQTSQITLQLETEPGLPRVMADPNLVKRMLNGMINRAVSRSEKGGVIQLSARNLNDQIWISIRDDGPAVTNADLPHIFEKSFTNAGSENSGLEMALVKSIIDRMGGQVWVGGQEKKGSTIFICLPVQNTPN